MIPIVSLQTGHAFKAELHHAWQVVSTRQLKAVKRLERKSLEFEPNRLTTIDVIYVAWCSKEDTECTACIDVLGEDKVKRANKAKARQAKPTKLRPSLGKGERKDMVSTG